MLTGNEPISAANLKAVIGAGRVLSRNVFGGSGTTNKYPSTAAARKVSFVGGVLTSRPENTASPA